MAKSRLESLKVRKGRVRKSLKTSSERPRLTVFRSNKHIYAQIIDDVSQKTLVSASTLSKELKTTVTKFDVNAAIAVGKLVGQKAKEAKIAMVAFDRGSYLYHGKIKALADAARGEGLKF
jgi:large subunit ribosomal protein L18